MRGKEFGGPDVVVLGRTSSCGAGKETGIEVLIEQNFDPLQGKRVGVITAQTGVTEDRGRIIDLLAHAPGLVEPSPGAQQELSGHAPPGGDHGAMGDQTAGARGDGRADAGAIH